MHSLFWKIFLTLWLSIVGFSAAIGWLNDKLARQQWAEEPANTFSRGMVRISQRAQQALLSEGRAGLRNELLTIPRMTRSHIYIVDEEGRELLRRDDALQQLTERRTPMDTTVFEDAGGDAFTIYTVSRSPPSTILAPGPEGTALRLGAAALISALISYFLARSLATPLEELRRASPPNRLGGARHAGRPFDAVPQGRNRPARGRLRRDGFPVAGHARGQPAAAQRRQPRAAVAVGPPERRAGDRAPEGGGANRDRGRPLALESQRLEALVNDVLGLLRESSEALRAGTRKWTCRICWTIWSRSSITRRPKARRASAGRLRGPAPSR